MTNTAVLSWRKAQQIIVILSLLLVSAACAAPATVAPSDTEAAAASQAVLTRAMTSEPASLDPHGPASSGLSLVLPYLFDTLVATDVDNTIVPLLAESVLTNYSSIRRLHPSPLKTRPSSPALSGCEQSGYP